MLKERWRNLELWQTVKRSLRKLWKSQFKVVDLQEGRYLGFDRLLKELE